MRGYIVYVGMMKQDLATRRAHEKEICLLLELDASVLAQTKFLPLHEKEYVPSVVVIKLRTKPISY